MMNSRVILSLAIIGAAAILPSCASEPQTAKKPVEPASFETPPNWLDRVSQVAYNPSKPEGEPALGDYEDEPSRFYFQGVPLMANEDDQSAEEEPAALPSDIISSRSFAPPG